MDAIPVIEEYSYIFRTTGRAMQYGDIIILYQRVALVSLYRGNSVSHHGQWLR